MAIQYSDEVFSGNMPFDEAKRKFEECIEKGIPVQALHFGTEEELNKRKEKASLEAKVKALEKKINELQPEPVSYLLHIPTREEIRSLLKE